MSSNDFIKKAMEQRKKEESKECKLHIESNVVLTNVKNVNNVNNVVKNPYLKYSEIIPGTLPENTDTSEVPAYNYNSIRVSGDPISAKKFKMTKRYAEPAGYPSSYHEPQYSESSEGEFSKEDLELVKSSLVVKEVDSTTMVTCIIIDKEQENPIIALRCVGQPLGGYIYDNAQDAYLVSGCYCFDLGQFSFALKLTVPGSGEWSQNIPIPNSVLENHFSAAQRKIIENNKKKYPSPRYEIKYIQMVS